MLHTRWTNYGSHLLTPCMTLNIPFKTRCRRRLNIDPLCRLNIDPGLDAVVG